MATPISDFGSALITAGFLWWQMRKLGKDEVTLSETNRLIEDLPSEKPIRVPD
jgi:hypothetical protein